MIVQRCDAKIRSGENIEILNYITKAECQSMSLAVAHLNGAHGPSLNSVSDRAYLIIEGDATVQIADEIATIGKGDAVYIPKNTVHSIRGKVAYVVINSPAFDPANEVAQQQD